MICPYHRVVRVWNVDRLYTELNAGRLQGNDEEEEEEEEEDNVIGSKTLMEKTNTQTMLYAFGKWEPSEWKT